RPFSTRRRRVRDPRAKAQSHSLPCPSRETQGPHHRGRTAFHGEGQSHRHESEGARNAPSMPVRAWARRWLYTDGHSRALVLVRLISLPRLLVPLAVVLRRFSRDESSLSLWSTRSRCRRVRLDTSPRTPSLVSSRGRPSSKNSVPIRSVPSQ